MNKNTQNETKDIFPPRVAVLFFVSDFSTDLPSCDMLRNSGWGNLTEKK